MSNQQQLKVFQKFLKFELYIAVVDDHYIALIVLIIMG
jgi:hypothetical protein